MCEKRWLCCGITLVEVLISWKFRVDAGNMLDNPWPLYIVIPWVAVLIVCAGGYLYLRSKKERTTIYGDLTVESEESSTLEKNYDHAQEEDEKKRKNVKEEGKDQKKEKKKKVK